LWLINADVAQIDQILINLCLNAKNSIAKTGKITIETSNSVCDAAFCAKHAGFAPGEYVRLAVSEDELAAKVREALDIK
jgi:signal transduction histidine kinase